MNDERQKKKKKAIRDLGPRDEWTVGEVLRLKFLLDNALEQLDGRPHYWAAFTLEKVLPIVKTFQKTVEKLEDFKEYQADQKAGYDEDKLKEEYPNFVAERDKLKDESADLSVRKFKVDWCLNYRASGALSAALIEFGLFDDPRRGEDLLYRDDRKR